MERRTESEQRFSPKAIAAFRKMHELEGKCTCPPRDWAGDYGNHQPCFACDMWWDQHSILYDELQCKPWDWPCIEHLDARSPYPEGCEADKNWKPDLEAQARYRASAEAAGIALADAEAK